MSKTYILISIGYIIIYEISNIIAQYFEILSPDPRFSSPWYPPAAFTVVLLFCYGLRYFPAVLFGQYILALVVFGFPPAILIPASIIPLGYLIIAFIGRRVLQIDIHNLDTNSIILFFILILFGTFGIGLVYNWFLFTTGTIHRDEMLRWVLNFAIGDSIGILVVAPITIEIIKILKGRFDLSPEYDFTLSNSLIDVVKDRYFILSFLFTQIILLIIAYLYIININIIYILFIPMLLFVLIYDYKGAVWANFLINIELIMVLSIFNIKIDGLLNLQFLMFILSTTALIMGIILRERIEYRDEVSELEELLEQTQNLENLGRLTSGIVHDFNNILFAIKTQTKLIEELSSEEEILSVKSSIEKTVERAKVLVEQLNSIHLPKTTELQPINVTEEVDLMEPLLRNLVGEIHFDINDMSENSFVLASKSQVQQIFLNLLVNARDELDEDGKITLTLRNIINQGEELLEIEIADNGPGIPDSIKNRIFEPYFSQKDQGTGLGLSIVEGIVNQLNGDINLDNNQPKGTKFCVRLPTIEEP